ncbi:YlxR family protein [Demequina sp.]|uniref:YlxR family protein n=1 Tax=Demequina sp. TaxID=2050685 RepID=UPI003A8A5CFC
MKSSRSDLVRLALDGHRVVVDGSKSLPGRGAWLHPDPDCLALALRRSSIGRALRCAGADASGVTLPGA